MFKESPHEFLQSEFDAVAAEVGKLAHEVEFEITEFVKDNVLGRVLSIKGETKSAAPVAEPVAEKAAEPEVEAEAPEATASTLPPVTP